MNASDSQRQNISLCLLAVTQDHLAYFHIPQEKQSLAQIIEMADLKRRLRISGYPIPGDDWYPSNFEPWVKKVRQIDPAAATFLVPYYERQNQEREQAREQAVQFPIRHTKTRDFRGQTLRGMIVLSSTPV
jgi:hypothetical protein